MKLCAFPNCENVLHSRNISSVCHIHLHQPMCKCAKCRGETVSRGDTRDRPGVRVVVVPYATGSSRIDGRMPVSLVKEPWG